jgi:hypothetical protein
MLSYGNVVRHRHTCIGTAFRLKPKMLIFQGKQTEITCQNGHRKKRGGQEQRSSILVECREYSTLVDRSSRELPKAEAAGRSLWPKPLVEAIIKKEEAKNKAHPSW